MRPWSQGHESRDLRDKMALERFGKRPSTGEESTSAQALFAFGRVSAKNTPPVTAVFDAWTGLTADQVCHFIREVRRRSQLGVNSRKFLAAELLALVAGSCIVDVAG